MLEKMNLKRWIALGVAVLILGLSAISSGLSSMINKEEQIKKAESMFMQNFDPQALTEKIVKRGDANNRILVLPIEGVIADTEISPFVSAGYNHQALLSSFEKLKEDPSIKGIILKVNSPGGGVFESAEIHKKILELKEETKLPIWTSMGNMAASGGYYVAAPTDKIYASPETITGSIGVIMGGRNITGLMEKLGIQDQTIKSAPHKDIGSTTRPMTEEDRAILQGLIDNMYGRFVNVVATGRNMDEGMVRTLADGRIYDGVQAQENGLVDEIGYFDDVVLAFSKEIKADNPQVIQYQTNDFSSFGSFFGSLNKESELRALSNILAGSYDNSSRPMYLHGGE